MTAAYVALIGDAIASRRLTPPARRRLQQGLRQLVAELNDRYARARAARFAITLGDEFQGLLRRPAPLWEIVHVVRARFPEVDWAIAAGRGPLATALPRNAAAPELDGPCFHAARAALEGAKRERRVLAFGGFPEPLGGLADYYSALYWSWTRRQRQAAAWLRLAPPAEAARRLGIDRSAVSHLATRMAWPLVAAGDKLVRHLIEAT